MTKGLLLLADHRLNLLPTNSMLGLSSTASSETVMLICLTYERFRISGKILGTYRTTGTWLLDSMHWFVVWFTCVPRGVPCSSHRTQASPSSSPSPSSSLVVTSVYDIHHKRFLLFLLLGSFCPLLFQGLENDDIVSEDSKDLHAGYHLIINSQTK